MGESGRDKGPDFPVAAGRCTGAARCRETGLFPGVFWRQGCGGAACTWSITHGNFVILLQTPNKRGWLISHHKIAAWHFLLYRIWQSFI